MTMNALNQRLRTQSRSISAAEPRRLLGLGFACPVFLVLYAAVAPRLEQPATEALRWFFAESPTSLIDHDTVFYFAFVGLSFLATALIAGVTAKLASVIGGSRDHHALFWICFFALLAIVVLLWQQAGGHADAAKDLFPLALGSLLGLGQGFLHD